MGHNGNGQCGFEKKRGKIEQPTLLLKDEKIFSICCGGEYSIILTSKNNFLALFY